MWIPRLINRVLQTVRAESNAIQQAVKSQGDAIRIDQQSAKDDQNEAAGAIAGAIYNTSNSAAGYEHLQRNKEYWLQVVLAAFTILAALGAAAAAIGTWYSLPKIQKSADAAHLAAEAASEQVKLYRKEIEGTQAAVIEHVTRWELDGNGLYIALANTGHVISPKVTVTVDVTRGPYPITNGHQVPIKHIQKAYVNLKPAPPSVAVPINDSPELITLWQPTPEDFNRTYRRSSMKETVNITGTILYDNGFGESPIEEPICDVIVILPAFSISGKERPPTYMVSTCSEEERVFLSMTRDRENQKKANQQNHP